MPRAPATRQDGSEVVRSPLPLFYAADSHRLCAGKAARSAAHQEGVHQPERWIGRQPLRPARLDLAPDRGVQPFGTPFSGGGVAEPRITLDPDVVGELRDRLVRKDDAISAGIARSSGASSHRGVHANLL